MTDSRRVTLIVGFAVAAVVAPVALWLSPLRFNASASVPVGLYRRVPGVARYAAICLSETVLSTALQAGLVVPKGECPDGKEPILKPLYQATAAAPISFTTSGFVIGNRSLANTAAKLRSRTGVALDHVAFGTYTTGLWAVSDYNPDSFDSRYFGPVSAAQVRYYAVPFVLF